MTPDDEKNDNHATFDVNYGYDALTFELIRSANGTAAWGFQQPSTMDDPLVQAARKFLLAWFERKMPGLEMPSLK